MSLILTSIRPSGPHLRPSRLLRTPPLKRRRKPPPRLRSLLLLSKEEMEDSRPAWVTANTETMAKL
jgi:hypothetical protein